MRARDAMQRAVIVCLNFTVIWGVIGLLRGCHCSSSPAAPSPALCNDHKDEPLAPALFLLGDSILDCGNNNDFITLAKVDYYPYGMDFPGNVPTGRFSNGFNPADYIAFKLGLPLIPCYHHPGTKGRRLLQGVNFASGGSGILPNTGKIYGGVDSLQEQVQKLRAVKEEVSEVVGESAAEELFAGAAFLVITGSNDWLLSFFNPIVPIRISDNSTSVHHHRDTLIHTLLTQIEAMYAIGARKIVVAGLPALGCCPSQVMEYNTNGNCADHINDVSKDYNEHLLPQVLALNEKFPNSSFSYIDIYTLILKAAQNPTQFGFKTGNTACCGIGKYKGFLTCLRGLHPCEHVEDHFYWDAYHPTQNFYPYLVDLIWNNGPPYAYPKSLQEIFNPKFNAKTKKDSHFEL